MYEAPGVDMPSCIAGGDPAVHALQQARRWRCTAASASWSAPSAAV